MRETQLQEGEGIPEGLDEAPRHYVLVAARGVVTIGTLEGADDESQVRRRMMEQRERARRRRKRPGWKR